MANILDTIKENIKGGFVKSALEDICALLDISLKSRNTDKLRELRNSAIVLLADIKGRELEQRTNLISNEEYNRAKSRILSATLQLAEDCDDVLGQTVNETRIRTSFDKYKSEKRWTKSFKRELFISLGANGVLIILLIIFGFRKASENTSNVKGNGNPVQTGTGNEMTNTNSNNLTNLQYDYHTENNSNSLVQVIKGENGAEVKNIFDLIQRGDSMFISVVDNKGANSYNRFVIPKKEKEYSFNLEEKTYSGEKNSFLTFFDYNKITHKYKFRGHYDYHYDISGTAVQKNNVIFLYNNKDENVGTLNFGNGKRFLDGDINNETCNLTLQEN
jgi:hypothetical protein